MYMNEMIAQRKNGGLEARNGKYDLLTSLIVASEDEAKEDSKDAPLSASELCGYVNREGGIVYSF